MLLAFLLLLSMVNIGMLRNGAENTGADPEDRGESAQISPGQESPCSSCPDGVAVRPPIGSPPELIKHWLALQHSLQRGAWHPDTGRLVRRILLERQHHETPDFDAEADELLRIDAVTVAGSVLLAEGGPGDNQRLWDVLSLAIHDSSARVRAEAALWLVRSGVLSDPGAPVDAVEFVLSAIDDPAFGDINPVRRLVSSGR